MLCYVHKRVSKGEEGSVAISNLREAFPNTKTSLSASSLPTGSASRRGSRTEKRIQLEQPDSSPGAIWPDAVSSTSFKTFLHQASAAMKMRFALFCDNAQSRGVTKCRSFGTTYRFLEDGTYTLFRNFPPELLLYAT